MLGAGDATRATLMATALRTVAAGNGQDACFEQLRWQGHSTLIYIGISDQPSSRLLGKRWT